MPDNRTEDERVFGPSPYVYCKSHMRPHTTGWCTVPARDKVLLAANTYEDACAEARQRGFKIYGEN